MQHVSSDSTDSAFDPDLLAEIADLRARGRPWDEVAQTVQWDETELRRALRNDRAYAAALDSARCEYEQEAEALALQALRGQISDTRVTVARAAAKIVLDYTAQKRADEVKLQVARIGAAGARARASAKARESDDDDVDEGPELTEEEKRHWVEEADRAAQKWARECAPVHLWGGCHKRWGTLPDGTDPRLYLEPDASVPGHVFYWALAPDQLGSDPFTGPFPTRPWFAPDKPAPAG